MNCSVCDHPLIDHGYDLDTNPCNCCTGKPEKSERNLPRGFVACTDFPDYMVNKYGTVKYIPTGKFCLLVRLSKTGEALINLRRDGKTFVRSAQELRDKEFSKEIA